MVTALKSGQMEMLMLAIMRKEKSMATVLLSRQMEKVMTLSTEIMN
jgi:hypothetical protein